MLAAILVAATVCGCGSQDDYYYDETDEEWEYEDGGDGQHDAQNADQNADEKSNAPAYETENVLPSPAAAGVSVNPSNAEFYADPLAYEHAKETNSLDYLAWLSDYCVNVVEPQAIEMLLRIPVIKEAADKDLLSRYITLGLTYNDVNQFGAITMLTPLDQQGRSVDEEQRDRRIRNIAHKIYVNTYEFDSNTQNDPAKIKELQDTLLHEMTHAIMADFTRNGGVGSFKDGTWAESTDQGNAFPDWFSEGCAITVQSGYHFTREDMISIFFTGPDEPRDDRMYALSSPELMFESLQNVQAALLEDDDEYSDVEFKNGMVTDITLPENQYLVSYYGTMYLYYLSAKSMGLEAFDSSGIMHMDIIMQGMENVLRKLNEGYSLNQLVAEISKDDSGTPLYEDVDAFERNYLSRADEPGFVFLQKMLYDFESRITDDSEYIPSGSVIPGFNNYQKDFMDDKPRSAASVYGIVCYTGAPGADCFAVSTVRPSAVALTGGYRRSYTDEPELTDDEALECDVLYIGDAIRLVDIDQFDDYKSPDEWIKIDDPARTATAAGTDENDLGEWLEDYDYSDDNYSDAYDIYEIPDLSSYGYVAGFTGTDDNNTQISADMYENSDGNMCMLLVIGGNSPMFGITDIENETGRAGEGIKLTLPNGVYVILYEGDTDPSMIEDENQNIYYVYKASEKEAREFANSLRR